MIRVLFFALVLFHGLIHLAGFVQAFNLARVGPLEGYISRPAGVAWLLAALLFVPAALFMFTGREWWWIPALPALLLSQILIVLSWQEAKLGTIPNLILLVAVVTSFSLWHFHLQADRDMAAIFSGTAAGGRTMTAGMVGDLPDPVQRWLHDSGVVGGEEIQAVYLKQRGAMRLNPGQGRWIKSEAEQSFNAMEPGFVWRVKTSMFGLPVVGRDDFSNGQGKMLIKLAGLVPVVDLADQPKLNESTMQRFLGEILWFPTAALSPYISWEAIDEHSARATMSYAGTAVSALFYFDEKGEPTRFVAERYREIDDEKPTPWVATVKAMETVQGVKIPTRLEASWILEGEEYTWYYFDVLDVGYHGGPGRPGDAGPGPPL